jgi:uncharacterized protein (TIGR00299 family) protein
VIGWLDCSAGVSGDMLLGALVDAGAPLEVLQAAVDAVVPGVALRTERVHRGGLAALRVHVDAADDAPARRWRDVRALLEAAALAEPVRATALRAFGLLAEAEARVHGAAVDDVHFHEVGALDAVADVVGAAAGFDALGLVQVTASAVAVGSGTVRGAHGLLPVPVPAVLALLEGAPVHPGRVAHEAATPTGAAVLRAVVAQFGPVPGLVIAGTGVGAGGRDVPEVPNVVRLVVGTAPEGRPLPDVPAAEAPGAALVVEATVDDLDPRLWPGVLQALLDAGAHDAWLTPVLMKKGRPAHVLSALCPPAVHDAVRDVVLAETTTIGLRSFPVARTVLDRDVQTVDVAGQPVRVKVARSGATVRNAMPEFDDVVAAAVALGRPVKDVLQAAHAAARALLD